MSISEASSPYHRFRQYLASDKGRATIEALNKGAVISQNRVILPLVGHSIILANASTDREQWASISEDGTRRVYQYVRPNDPARSDILKQWAVETYIWGPFCKQFLATRPSL